MTTTTLNVGQAAKLLNAKRTNRVTAPTPSPLEAIMQRLAALEAENAALKAKPAKAEPKAASKPTITGIGVAGEEKLKNGLPGLVIAHTMSDGSVKRAFRIGGRKVAAFLALCGDPKTRAALSAFAAKAGNSDE